MTPGARAAAAIDVLDAWLYGEPAPRALLRWGRGARYAGSGDRAAVADLVYDGLRRLRSSATLGGAMTGRGVMIGLLGEAARELFGAGPHAPAALSAEESARLAAPPPLTRAERLDVPDWLLPRFDAALGKRADDVLKAMRHRAPVHLRVNRAREDREGAIESLRSEGIDAVPHPLSPSALEVVSGARRVAGSAAYKSGLVELQDAASQAVADLVPASAGLRVLDYCAGGGGKALALAARGADVHAHDAEPRRMADLAARAARAGARIAILSTAEVEDLPPWPVVLVDAPCSGSGSWRRDPGGKWRLTEERLHALTVLQEEILVRAAALVAPGGCLVYATCSMLREENASRVEGFRKSHPDWCTKDTLRLSMLDGGDGFGAESLIAPSSIP